MGSLRERFPFWGLEYRRIEGERLAYASWLWALGMVGVSVILYPLVEALKPSAVLYFLLGMLILAHLQARSMLERAMPVAGFAEDLRTGNLEQLRLLPWTAHALLLHRQLPAFFSRAAVLGVWLALYALWSLWAGMGAWDGLALWVLFSFAPYPVLAMASFYLLIPGGWLEFGWVFVPILLGYAFWTPNQPSQSAGVSSWVMALLAGLPVMVRLLMPERWMTTLPDIVPFVGLWLVVEGVRWERQARWLNAPSGWGRGYRWLAASAFLLFGAWQTSEVLRLWVPGGAAKAELLGVVVFFGAGYLNLLWLDTVRGREKVLQRWRHHLMETLTLRLWSLLLLGLALLWLGWAPQVPPFWAMFAALTAVEILLGSLFRYGFQRAAMHTERTAWSIVLLGAAPALLYPLATLIPWLQPLTVMSPTVALFSRTPAWSWVKLPLWATLVLPCLRYAGVLALIWVAGQGERTLASVRPIGVAARWLGYLLGYGILDLMARRESVNPVFRLLVRERRGDFVWLLGLGALLFTLLTERGAGMFLALSALPFVGGWIWYWGYMSAHRTVRKLIDSGELKQWFLANLKPTEIYWGIIYAHWYFQGRVVVGFIVGALLGGIARAAMANAAVWAIPLGFGASLFVGVMAIIWACAWLIAAPNGVRDALLLTPNRRGVMATQVALKAMLISGVSCIAFMLAPLILLGLPLYYNQSLLTLQRLHRYPEAS